jgi:hypothetical protein
MKNINKICVLLFLTSISAAGYAQAPQTPDSLGLPGDNLNLYGVLALFKESKSVEEFEQKLNTPDNKVNNLDLNHDGQTDYIRVKDYGKGGLHSLVLQDPITATESQDLAVIEIEQQGNDVAHVQIVGDEDLYGKNYIIEPQDQQQAQQAPPPVDNIGANYSPPPPVFVNVWGWPSVQFMYGPSYVYWNSPYYWGYYPHWWNPWRPMGFHSYWMGMYGYRGFQHRVYENRIIAAQNIYYGHRQTSVIVHNNITNNVYHGPRTGGRAATTNPGNSGNSGGPRGGGGRKAVSNNTNTQPKQQSAPRQQVAPKQVQNAPKQQSAPRQQTFQQPKQQAAPKQQVQRQEAPHNNGGGARMGGGGHGGSGHGGRK